MASLIAQNKDKPGVSVVIPAYTYARFLPKAIDSILKQDYPNYEIIVVDDGSTDNTKEVVAVYGDKVRYIYQKNAGLPAARNTGIKAAGYNFVGFLDADDEWMPNRMSEAMAAFSRLSPEFAIVASRAVVVDSNGTPIDRKQIFSREAREITCRDILLKTQFSPSSVVARREALESCGMFDPTLRSSEDRDMWIRITSRYRAYLSGDGLIIARRHSNNMSKHADRMTANTRRVLRQAYENGCVPKSAVFVWLCAFSFNRFETAWMYWDEGRKGEAIREVIFSLLMWPFFTNPSWLNEPTFFRLRSLLRFVRKSLTDTSKSSNAMPQAS